MKQKTKKQLLKELDKVDAKLLNKSALKKRRIINKQLDSFEKQENKKQNWIMINLLEIILISLILIFASVGFVYSRTDKYFCSQNPSKCVCEEYEKILLIEDTTNFEDTPKFSNINSDECLKFRKKTQDELLIDDCNSNPREDGKCKCEKFDFKEEINIATFRLENISISTKIPKGCFFDRLPTINCNRGFDDENFTCDLLNYKIICGNPNPDCLKSRPKTECEKGNPDWVEETKCIQNKEFLENYTTKELKCPEVIDNPTDIAVQHIPCSSELIEVTIYHFVKKEICIQNQTICREKI